MEGIIRAWGKILAGRRPNLSIEITRECPLRCPGCYAYGDEHLGGGQTLRDAERSQGPGARRRHHRSWSTACSPLHVSLVGGEPLVRYRELDVVLPQLAERGLYVQVVTSAVRPIPAAWASIPRLQICVSIDGLQPEHDARRAPATYDRILKHIDGHQITVHCTVTRQQTAARRLHRGVRRTVVEQSQRAIDLAEPLHAAGRRESLTSGSRPRIGGASSTRCATCASRFPKLQMPDSCSTPTWIRHRHRRPTASLRGPPNACRRTCRRQITPCQFGGTPGLRELRLHGVGRSGRGRASSSRRRDPHRRALQRIDSHRPGRERLAARPTPPAYPILLRCLRAWGAWGALGAGVPWAMASSRCRVVAARSSASCTLSQMFASPRRS